MGDILVCAMSGEFLIYVPQSPRGQRIDCVIPYSRGLIFSGTDLPEEGDGPDKKPEKLPEVGYIWPFEATSNES